MKKRSFNFWTRKTHRWGAIICCIPLLLVIASGLLLQVKKQVAWVQPPTVSAKHSILELNWAGILESATNVPEAEISTWTDIDRLDVRPSKGIAKVQSKNRWELQIDLQSGEVLSSRYRRSDFIESLHDGSFFGEWAKLAVFLPNGFVLLILWFTGMWLWYLPLKVKREKRIRNAQKKSASEVRN